MTGDKAKVFGEISENLRGRPAALGPRPRLGHLQQKEAEVFVAGRQKAAQIGDGVVVVRQLLHNRHRRAELGLRVK
jgi:hypothetical protein